MKRFFLLLVLITASPWMRGQAPFGPGIYVWTGDTNWSIWDLTHHNNHPNSSLGAPYALAVDVGTPGTLKYSFTAGIGGGYRGDQIIFWVNRPVYWGLVMFTDPVDGGPSGVEMSFSTQAARDTWVDAMTAVFILYDPRPSAWQIDWQILGIGGSPHGVPSASEISNDSTQRGATYADKTLAYDLSEYGGAEIRASYWTFQRTAGNEQKLEMQDRGPWTLPRDSGPSVNLNHSLATLPTVSISPIVSTVSLGQSITLNLEATNASSVGNILSGEGAPSFVPLVGSVQVTPISVGIKTYIYSVIGQASLLWSLDDPSATLILNTPTGPKDVTAPPLGRYISVPGVYTLTATNSAGISTTSNVVTLVDSDFATATATATITVIPPSTGGTAALSVVPDAPGTIHPRCWLDNSGGYTALMARASVNMKATATADPSESIASLELQAKSPKDSDWQTLGSRAPANTSNADETFTFMIDSARGGSTDPKGILPRDPSLAGTWTYRVLAHFQSGHVATSAEQPLLVLSPIKSTTVTAQTLPPADSSAKWYAQSEVKTYTVNLILP